MSERPVADLVDAIMDELNDRSLFNGIDSPTVQEIHAAIEQHVKAWNTRKD